VRHPAPNPGGGSLAITNASAANGLTTALTVMGHSAVRRRDRWGGVAVPVSTLAASMRGGTQCGMRRAMHIKS
jgi:hypothetical protein